MTERVYRAAHSNGITLAPEFLRGFQAADDQLKGELLRAFLADEAGREEVYAGVMVLGLSRSLRSSVRHADAISSVGQRSAAVYGSKATNRGGWI